jgi:hypothetical protein
VVDIEFRARRFWITTVGSYSPSDAWEGKVLLADAPGSTAGEAVVEVLKDLPRPVHTTFADLNRDGRDDLLVCGYGNILGKLTWFESLADGSFREHVLLERPGAIRAYVHDFNQDGLPDIIVMFAQAREGIYILTNQGNGNFSSTPVVEQHPAWGNSYFELADFNGDGHPDLLACNGDNGDFTDLIPPTKAYHGIRIYLNDGRNHFKEAWTYPMNGVYKAMARDFDGDGDLDIAAISFYPDYFHSARESFLYFENTGSLQFQAASFSEGLSGRWLGMDVGDLDGDGDPDIVLGAFNDGPTLVPEQLRSKWREIGPTVLILKNNRR